MAIVMTIMSTSYLVYEYCWLRAWFVLLFEAPAGPAPDRLGAPTRRGRRQR